MKNKDDKLISQAKCATVDACLNCKYFQTTVKNTICPKCHVHKLIEMLLKLQEEDKA